MVAAVGLVHAGTWIVGGRHERELPRHAGGRMAAKAGWRRLPRQSGLSKIIPHPTPTQTPDHGRGKWHRLAVGVSRVGSRRNEADPFRFGTPPNRHRTIRQ